MSVAWRHSDHGARDRRSASQVGAAARRRAVGAGHLTRVAADIATGGR
jgi:hypothetical protein